MVLVFVNGLVVVFSLVVNWFLFLAVLDLGSVEFDDVDTISERGVLN